MFNKRRRIERLVIAVQIISAMLSIANFASSYFRFEPIAQVMQKIADR